MIERLPAGSLVGFDWLLLVLATWRVCVMLVEEDGPYRILDRLRSSAPYPVGDNAGVGSDNGVLACVWCLSVWIAPVIMLVWFWAGIPGRLAVIMLSVSGGTIFAQEIMRYIRGV